MDRATLGAVAVLAAAVTLIACTADPGSGPRIASKKFPSYGWAPLTCPSPWNFGSVYPFSNSIDQWQAKKLTELTHYANHTNRPWRMLVNQNVRTVGYRFSSFDVEAGYDYLDVKYKVPGGYGINHHTGQTPADFGYPPIGQYILVDALGGGWMPAYLDFTWHTDQSVNYLGYHLDSFQLHCRIDQGQSPVNQLEIQTNYPYTGYLIGTNDVIYVKVVQPAGYPMTLNLWTHQPGADFDVHASSTDPLPTAFGQWNGQRSGPKPELVKIPAFGSIGQPGRWIYIAIGSWEGQGGFRFYANLGGFYNSQRTAGTDWNPSQPVKDYIIRILHKMSVATYLATEGRFLIDSWIVHWNQPGYGMFQFHRNQVSESSHCNRTYPNPETTCWPGNSDTIDLATDHWCRAGCAPADTPTCQCHTSEADAETVASEVLLHELGHCDGGFGFRDEYLSTYNCGHSAMAGYSHYQGNVTDFCNYYNGGEDSSSGHSKEENNWACMASRLYLGNPVQPPVPVDTTPDAFYKLYGLNSVDFEGAVTVTAP